MTPPNLIVAAETTTGTPDDWDDRDDEHAGENEIPVRETSEGTEAPEEFEVDDEDELGHPEDDDADEEFGDLSDDDLDEDIEDADLDEDLDEDDDLDEDGDVDLES